MNAKEEGLKGRKWLAKLDQTLADWHDDAGFSMTKFKQAVRQQAICLGNMQEYHNQQALRNALMRDPSKRVRLGQAKDFKYVKMCLVKL